jgi:hypothetical protein
MRDASATDDIGPNANDTLCKKTTRRLKHQLPLDVWHANRHEDHWGVGAFVKKFRFQADTIESRKPSQNRRFDEASRPERSPRLNTETLGDARRPKYQRLFRTDLSRLMRGTKRKSDWPLSIQTRHIEKVRNISEVGHRCSEADLRLNLLNTEHKA